MKGSPYLDSFFLLLGVYYFDYPDRNLIALAGSSICIKLFQLGANETKWYQNLKKGEKKCRDNWKKMARFWVFVGFLTVTGAIVTNFYTLHRLPPSICARFELPTKSGKSALWVRTSQFSATLLTQVVRSNHFPNGHWGAICLHRSQNQPAKNMRDLPKPIIRIPWAPDSKSDDLRHQWQRWST